jgi:hypothetical protein
MGLRICIKALLHSVEQMLMRLGLYRRSNCIVRRWAVHRGIYDDRAKRARAGPTRATRRKWFVSQLHNDFEGRS